MSEWTDTGGDTDNVPEGTVVMWTGDSDDTPNGWTLCDGQNPDGPDSDVPDLRNRFVVGAGDEYSKGEKGGEKEHQLTEDEMPSHGHSYQETNTNNEYCEDGYGTASYNTWANSGSSPNTTGTAGNDQPHENRPPFYALAYIVRISGGGGNPRCTVDTDVIIAVFTVFFRRGHPRGTSMISTSHNHEQVASTVNQPSAAPEVSVV